MHLKPLIFGRAIRIVTGVLAIGAVLVWGTETFMVWGVAILIFFGVSFIIGGINANSGCEITAIPNLFRPADKKLHCA